MRLTRSTEAISLNTLEAIYVRGREGKASVEAVAHYNLLLTQALFEVLEAKGLVTKAEVTERLQRLKAETKLNLESMK